MPVTDEQFARLEARVSGLERAQNLTVENQQLSEARWSRVIATQNEQHLRLERIEARQIDQSIELVSHSRILDGHLKVIETQSRLQDEHARKVDEQTRPLKEIVTRLDAMPALVAETIRAILQDRGQKSESQ